MDGCPRHSLQFVGCYCLLAVGCVAQQLPREPFGDAAAQTQAEVSASPPISPYARGPAQARPGDTTPPANVGAAAAAQETGDPAALQGILAELQSLGTVDPATQNQLLADLRQTDPKLWPMLMQTFRAGAVYRQKTTTNEPTATSVARVVDARETEKPQIAQRSTAAKPEATPTVNTDAMLQAIAAQQFSGSPSAAPGMPPLPMEALKSQFVGRGDGAAPGLALPTQAIIGAALAEAQQKEAEQTALPPPLTAQASVTPTSATQTIEKKTPTPEKKTPAADASGSPIAPDPADTAWRDSLTASIEALERLTAEPPHNAQEVTRHAWLRMLYLTAGRREDALKPIPGIAAAEQDFWREQIYALATCLDTERTADPAKRSAEARKHLAKADSRLAETGTLAVRNLAFCTEVSSYGVYEKFDEYEFKANQPLILYAEVQNFKSEESAKGFHTSLRSSYQILDGQGRRVAENDLALTEEYCQNERRDYFIRYFLSVPERIYDGNYTLQLTIVDTLSQKIGQAIVDFKIGGGK